MFTKRCAPGDVIRIPDCSGFFRVTKVLENGLHVQKCSNQKGYEPIEDDVYFASFDEFPTAEVVAHVVGQALYNLKDEVKKGPFNV